LKTTDHGDPLEVRAHVIGASGERWVEPFLQANAPSLPRLRLKVDVCADSEVYVRLTPGARIGAMPLVGPATRRVVAGILVEPRFRWPALGAVFNSIGFTVEPALGGSPLVPGSARDVPPWILAGPVIQRVAALLRHSRRSFVEHQETRSSLRGRVLWPMWISTQLPRGAWTQFPCRYSEPESDPCLLANARWTLSRLMEELSRVAWSPPGRFLLRRADELLLAIGPGTALRPGVAPAVPAASEWLRDALEAMAWVAEERGLGGARSLDGLAWDLSIDSVWEAWIAAFAGRLGGRLGMSASPFAGARRVLRWVGPVQSMGSLAPDVELRSAERVVWIDAKYKPHLQLLARRGWSGVSEEIRGEHRADLHQALAYASLADVAQIDTLLLYPSMGSEPRRLDTVATVTSGRRRVRLILASVPFGYRSPEHEEADLAAFRELLTG
jgi:hypothetical protein